MLSKCISSTSDWFKFCLVFHVPIVSGLKWFYLQNKIISVMRHRELCGGSVSRSSHFLQPHFLLCLTSAATGFMSWIYTVLLDTVNKNYQSRVFHQIYISQNENSVAHKLVQKYTVHGAITNLVKWWENDEALIIGEN